MSPQRYVLFDCDGVLVDSEPVTNRVLRDNLAAHGLKLSLDQIAALFVGGTMKGAMEQARLRGAAGIGYAVGSNGPMAKMQITLRRCGLWSRLEGRVFSAHDCAAAKPAPDVYLKAAAAAGVAPEACVVVEDSPTGARAAVAAGMPCCGYVGAGPAARMQPYCIATFDSMAALPGLLAA